jgi:hypothetical protein
VPKSATSPESASHSSTPEVRVDSFGRARSAQTVING